MIDVTTFLRGTGVFHNTSFHHKVVTNFKTNMVNYLISCIPD